LGVPIKVTTTPIEIAGGWRFPSASRGRVTPYVGGGLLIQKYAEKSTFAGAGDDVSQTNRGFSVLGGAEFAIFRRVIVGGEAQYRGVPNAIGAGSVSSDFNETNLGGFTIRAIFGIKR
jgi:opacity protein-like surface antigen